MAMTSSKSLEQIMRFLPPEIQNEVTDFATYLWEKKLGKPGLKKRTNVAHSFLPFNRLKGILKPLHSSEKEISTLKKIWDYK